MTLSFCPSRILRGSTRFSRVRYSHETWYRLAIDCSTSPDLHDVRLHVVGLRREVNRLGRLLDAFGEHGTQFRFAPIEFRHRAVRIEKTPLLDLRIDFAQLRRRGGRCRCVELLKSRLVVPLYGCSGCSTVPATCWMIPLLADCSGRMTPEAVRSGSAIRSRLMVGVGYGWPAFGCCVLSSVRVVNWPGIDDVVLLSQLPEGVKPSVGTFGVREIIAVPCIGFSLHRRFRLLRENRRIAGHVVDRKLRVLVAGFRDGRLVRCLLVCRCPLPLHRDPLELPGSQRLRVPTRCQPNK